MPETSHSYRCLDYEDKKLILKIIDETISRENEELRKIVVKRTREMLRPPFVESFTNIRSSLVRVREDFKKNIELLKERIDEYPECTKMIKPPITEIGINVRYPKSDMPVPYAQRKIF